MKIRSLLGPGTEQSSLRFTGQRLDIYPTERLPFREVACWCTTPALLSISLSYRSPDVLQDPESGDNCMTIISEGHRHVSVIRYSPVEPREPGCSIKSGIVFTTGCPLSPKVTDRGESIFWLLQTELKDVYLVQNCIS